MPNKEYKRFFPFCPGIPWKIEYGKYVIPSVTYDTWCSKIRDKEFVVVCYGSLFETLVSLSCAETLLSLENKPVFWIGNKKYYPLINTNGLFKISVVNLTKKRTEKYPTPVFFDRENRCYFNILNNYKLRRNWYGKHPWPNKKPAIQQAFDNCLLPWSNHLPVLRNKKENDKINRKSKNIFIIVDSSDNSSLDWSIQQIKEFSAMVSPRGFQVIVFSKNIYSFAGTRILALPYDELIIINDLDKAFMVLSTNIEWLLISLLLSNAHLVCLNVFIEMFDLFKNAEFIGASNPITVENDSLSPLDVFKICVG